MSRQGVVFLPSLGVSTFTVRHYPFMAGKMSSSWHREEVKQLKKAFKAIHQEYPDISKGEKWRMVAEQLGGGRTKRECYDKYKELLDIRAKEKESKRKGEEEEEDEGHGASSSSHRRRQSGSTTAAQARASFGSRSHSDSLSSTDADSIPPPHEPSASKSMPTSSGRRRPSFTDTNEEAAVMSSDFKGSFDRLSINERRSDSSRSPPTFPAQGGPRAAGRSGGGGGGHKATADEITIEDCEDFEEDDTERAAPPPSRPSTSCSSNNSRGASSSSPASSSSDRRRGSGGSVGPSSSSYVSGGGQLKGTPITADMAAGLRALLFGDENARFNHAWLQQEFVFSRYQDLGFGLMQHKGGPCGVLAAVQAFFLAHLLHHQRTTTREGGMQEEEEEADQWKDPREAQRKASLAWALSTIIWQAAKGSSSRKAVVAVAGEGSTLGIKSDGVTERVQTFTIGEEGAVQDFVRTRLDRFMIRGGGGVVLLTYSVMLSRGLEQIRSDMDDAFGGSGPKGAGTLIDRHGYATQELVNLLLIGRAHSNVFDGERLLDDTSGKSEDVVRLRGIPFRGTVGFLTLFEAYRYFEVGRHYKEPELPIWVVCSESHYSVLFLPPPPPPRAIGGRRDKDDDPSSDSSSRFFTLHYFDGLANQQEPIILTVDHRPAKPPPLGPDDDRLIPPLDLVIRTKWPGVAVEWSGDPIL